MLYLKTDSNYRHKDFQSLALPTELFRQLVKQHLPYKFAINRYNPMFFVFFSAGTLEIILIFFCIKKLTNTSFLRLGFMIYVIFICVSAKDLV